MVCDDVCALPGGGEEMGSFFFPPLFSSGFGIMCYLFPSARPSILQGRGEDGVDTEIPCGYFRYVEFWYGVSSVCVSPYCTNITYLYLPHLSFFFSPSNSMMKFGSFTTNESTQGGTCTRALPVRCISIKNLCLPPFQPRACIPATARCSLSPLTHPPFFMPLMTFYNISTKCHPCPFVSGHSAQRKEPPTAVDWCCMWG